MDVRVRFAVNDQVLSYLHSRAFGCAMTTPQPWAQRLQRHSLTWVGAFDRDSLIGFVHACWDGGSHAFVLDTAVDPDHQRQGRGNRRRHWPRSRRALDHLGSMDHRWSVRTGEMPDGSEER